MSSSASPAPSRRKTLLSLGVLALLTGIVVFIFREHWAEISEALSRLTLGQGLLALAVGLSYPLLEGVSSWLIVRSRLSHFPLRQGIDNAGDALHVVGHARERVGQDIDRGIGVLHGGFDLDSGQFEHEDGFANLAPVQVRHVCGGAARCIFGHGFSAPRWSPEYSATQAPRSSTT